MKFERDRERVIETHLFAYLASAPGVAVDDFGDFAVLFDVSGNDAHMSSIHTVVGIEVHRDCPHHRDTFVDTVGKSLIHQRGELLPLLGKHPLALWSSTLLSKQLPVLSRILLMSCLR